MKHHSTRYIKYDKRDLYDGKDIIEEKKFYDYDDYFQIKRDLYEGKYIIEEIFFTIMTNISKYQKTTHELSTTILEVTWKKIYTKSSTKEKKPRQREVG